MMSAGRSKYAWIVISLASIFIYLKTDAIPLSSIAKPSLLSSPQLVERSYGLDDISELGSISKNILKRSADTEDNNVENGDDDNKDSTTEKPSGSDSNFHHGDHGHGHGHTVLKQPHPPHGDHDHGSHHNDDDRNNSGSGFNILEFFGTIFRLVWGFVSNIPALLFGTSSSSSSGGQ